MIQKIHLVNYKISHQNQDKAHMPIDVEQHFPTRPHILIVIFKAGLKFKVSNFAFNTHL